MHLVAAQIAPVVGNLEQSIDKHLSVIQRAADLHAAAVFFPELSLTGYEPRQAQQLAMPLDDPRFEVFQETSDRHQMLIAIGVPMRTESGVEISMVVFQPKRMRCSYSKQQLHPDEQAFFIAGRESALFTVAGLRVAPAICFESLQADHAQQAAAAGAQVYFSSVAKSAKGIAAVKAHYPLIAQCHGFTVIMANSVGPADDFTTAGQSGVWKSDGEPLCVAGESVEALVMFDTRTGCGHIVAL